MLPITPTNAVSAGLSMIGYDSLMTTATPSSPVSLQSPSQPARFTVTEFDKMLEAGALPERAELVDGEIRTMAAIGYAHVLALEDLRDALRAAWPRPKFIATQGTHRFTPTWAPMPDILLLDERPIPRRPLDKLPRLVVEISDDSLAYDLGLKRLRYAQCGVPEYWVADLRRRQVFIFRQPDPDATEAVHAYADETIVKAHESLSPLAIPEWSITVAEVLPAAGAE